LATEKTSMGPAMSSRRKSGNSTIATVFMDEHHRGLNFALWRTLEKNA
jgi:hypothetical protein